MFSYFFSHSIGFLCPLSANRYGIEFLSFSIQDYGTKEKLFETGSDDANFEDTSDDIPMDEDSFRKIKYNFSEQVLRLPLISTS